jgi:pimeloyl-ACP methyl ester carboxylesterase
VRDIGYVIKHLGQKDFIIFGHSYGTVSATHLAFHLENDLSMRPRAVVLMGTVGHKFGAMRDWHVNHIDQWQRLKSEYPKAGLLFANGRLPDLGGTRAEWGRYLFNVGNHYRESGEQLEALNDELSASASGGGEGPIMRSIRKKFYGRDPPYHPPLPSYVSFVFTRISCQEIFNPLDSYGSSIDRNGNMELIISPNTPQNNDMCEGIAERFPYDSKNFQLQSPLIYLHGETDPQVPLSQCYYHFLNQNLSRRKEWILVERGSHSPLDDALNPCTEQIWNAIKRGDFVSSLLTSNGYCLQDAQRHKL